MKIQFFIALSLALFFATCHKDKPTPDCAIQITEQERVFEFLHQSTGDTYLAWTSNPTVIQLVEAQLALPQSQRNQHINGKILRLPEDCNLNEQWSWYFAPDDWSLVDQSIELCDGNPQFVEDNLAEYVDNIGRYCPWGGIVLRDVTD